MNHHPKKFFRPEEEARIVGAIKEAELQTSGEIRVHLARHCKGAAYEAAVKIFEKLGMTKTVERNGILIYIALKKKEFAIIGDKSIHEKVSQDFWHRIRDAMQTDFKKGEFAKGILDGIRTCGEELARYFPRKSDDKNELSDSISGD